MITWYNAQQLVRSSTHFTLFRTQTVACFIKGRGGGGPEGGTHFVQTTGPDRFYH